MSQDKIADSKKMPQSCTFSYALQKKKKKKKQVNFMDKVGQYRMALATPILTK